MENAPWLQLCLGNNEMFRSHLLTEKKKLQQNRAVQSAKNLQFEGRKKGRQEKEREVLYGGITTDTNTRFIQKTSFNFALTNINVYFSFVKSYYFKCYNKTQTVINLCTRGSVKGSYKKVKTISTNSKTSWRIKTQGFNSELYFTIKTQTNNNNNNKTLFIKIVLIPFQTLFWPWDHSKTRKKGGF